MSARKLLGRTDGLPRCGALMRNIKEPCVRAAGHRWEHRSRFALDNQYRAAMGHEPDPFVWRAGEWVLR